MDLIIKPLEACNFKCTFCSSTNISSSPYNILDIKLIKQFLDRFPHTNTIIVNGGEPLLMKPDWYWEILNYIVEKGLQTTLSFTSNLWVFYKNPEPWIPLFKHEQVFVGTSFNYGETRLINETTVLTEEIFVDVVTQFKKHIGYTPDFISVINEFNDAPDLVLKNVLLAKELGAVCKLNYAMCSGAQESPYMMAKMYQFYLKIYQLGLQDYEYNTLQFIKSIKKSEPTTCPLLRACDEGIRCIQPDGDYYSCGSFADDKNYPIDFTKEVINGDFITPLQNDPNLFCLKDDCLSCPMFDICNGCKKTIYDMKEQGMEFIQEHCSIMKNVYAEFVSPTQISCFQI